MKRLVLAWVVTAIAATGAAVAVLGLLGSALTGSSGRVLSQGEIRAALSSVTPRPATPSAAPSTTPSVTSSVTSSVTPSDTSSASPSVTSPETSSPPAPREELIRTAGGTVIASCEGDEVTLRSWSPAQGYSVDGVEPGPRHEAKVEFEPDEGEEVEVRIGCSAGRPVTLRH
ncbi:hypothetical protein [Nonomuraea sp. NPDC048916]|uniref:hypothetical protein n=1 Tax=Nonomuraea sp. NPDC048916 TaxID=3154232 RepID=UPI0033D1B8D5